MKFRLFSPERSRQRIVAAILVMLLSRSASAGDWPAYRHDARRSAVSTDQLDFPLHLAWQHKARRPPRPAFADPLSHPTGIDFAYTRDHSEPVLLDFDYAYHPVAAKGRVFVGSSADDTVRCLSLTTGDPQWVFVTGGPVRFAPQVVDDRVYVASDDGFVYCLAAGNGDLIWQFRAAPSARQLVGNGRMISRWPLRTGALVLDGTVYVTAGMWPAEGVFVYALDASTGEIRWVNDTSGTVNQATANPGAYAIAGVAPTGYLLAGNDALVVPTGRSIPASYALRDGQLLASVAPSYQNRRGGPAVCIDPHGSVIFGYPRERLTGTAYSVHYAYRLPQMQPFGSIRADRVIVDDKTYVAVNDLIRCYVADSRYRKVTVQWQADRPSKNVRCMSLAANALLLGIDNGLIARDRQTGTILWQHDGLDGYVKSIAVADGQLLVATDAGRIYCFGVQGTDGLLNPSDSEPPETATTGGSLSLEPSHPINSGPNTLFTEFLTTLESARIRRGLALVIGHRDTALAAQLAATTQLQVVLLLDDADAVMEARRDLLEQTDLEHGQVSVQQTVQNEPLPFADFAFNVIATTADIAVTRTAELQRVLRPAGGMLYVDHATDDVATRVAAALRAAAVDDEPASSVPAGDDTPAASSLARQPTNRTDEIRRVGQALVYRRGKLAGALDWDSETDKDERVKWPLELLWFGGPGSKRTGSGSRPPVAAGGRNLVIGKNHLICLDAYNGTELWSRTLPYLYRNIGRLKKAPGPITPWLTESISADDDFAYLNFGHVVYTLDASTGQQRVVHGALPAGSRFCIHDQPRFVLDHFQRPDTRGTAATATRAPQPAGEIQLALNNIGQNLTITLQLDPTVEITDKVYWELFLDARQPHVRANLYSQGIFQLIAWPASGRVDAGLGPAHPKVSVAASDGGRRMILTINTAELGSLGSVVPLVDFAFAAALNHQTGAEQKGLAGGRGYLRWELFADKFAYAFNNGWARIAWNRNAEITPIQLSAISELPEHALRAGRIGRIGKRAGYVVSVGIDRENPLSLEVAGFEFNRGKGCGMPVSSDSLQVLRSGTLAFYDLDDDSGMRYFGGVRPSCTISAVPAQGLVFAAEGSSGCSCNYNFKATLALAPARHRRHEDWAMFMAPLSPAALLRTGRFNLAAPGDRRDDDGGLWLQYPRAPTLPNRSMPVPVELSGQSLEAYRVNADRVPIAGTKRPWLYTSGFAGIEGVRLQLFMSDKEGVVVFPSDPPALDAVLEDAAWERRYAVPAGAGSSMFLSHNKDALYVGYELMPPVDRRGNRQPWQTTRDIPHATRFTLDEPADDATVWQEDSLEFLVSDTSLKTILHFGVGLAGGRYDGLWSSLKNHEDAAYTGRWAGATAVTAEKATAEISVPWQTLIDAGLDLKNLVIRPRTRQPLVRQPHITHGFRPLLLQGSQPVAKRYRVALHFVELDDVAVGQRVFDIQLQGSTVLKDFDPVAAAGGRFRAVVRVFAGIRADRALEIRLIPRATLSTIARPPTLAAVEVLLDN